MSAEPEHTLTADPPAVHFGRLRGGDVSEATVRVSGGPAVVIINSDRLQVTPNRFGMEETELRVKLAGAVSGELLWDVILLKGDRTELPLVVTAWWEGQAAVSSPPPTKDVHGVAPLMSRRSGPIKGHVCSHCGKNFSYLESTHSWEECHCGPVRRLVNEAKHIVIELRFGIRDIPGFLMEAWRIIRGKEKM